MDLLFLLPLVIGVVWCINTSVGNIGRQLPVFIAMALLCASPIQAAEGPGAYCMSAGAENDYDCAKAGAGNSNNQVNIDTKLSKLLRWLEDEERANNGNSLSNLAVPGKMDNKLQQKIEFNSKLLADELQQARTLQDKGDHPQGFDLINSYLTNNPKDLNGWLIYGIALMDQNKLQAAEDIFNKLIQLYPDAPEPYNNLAAIYARRGDNNKAIDILLQGFNTHPSYAQLRLNLKAVYTNLANQVYNRALDPDEKDTLVTSNLIILDQAYIATPVAPVYFQAETTLSAAQPVMTATKAKTQQSFVSSPAVQLEVASSLRNRQWLFAQPKGDYVAQLIQLPEERAVKRFIHDSGVIGKVDYYRTRSTLGNVYLVIYRQRFDSFVAARNKIKELLPSSLAKGSWIRTFQSLQESYIEP